VEVNEKYGTDIASQNSEVKYTHSDAKNMLLGEYSSVSVCCPRNHHVQCKIFTKHTAKY
jgi:hypothetical protein